MYGYDYSYLIFVLPAVLLSLLANVLVKGRFSRYDTIKSSCQLTGAQTAQFLLQKNNIYDVQIVHIRGKLTDNYNPGKKILSLSDSTYNNSSIAAIGVAAHETGHAIQHAINYGPLALRSALVPVANIGSRFGPALAVLGILFGNTANTAELFSLCQLLTNLGIILFCMAVLFYLVTLPVEFNASRRALRTLKKTGILKDWESTGVRKVLSAAALTYVASALTAIGSLLRLLFLSNSRKTRR